MRLSRTVRLKRDFEGRIAGNYLSAVREKKTATWANKWCHRDVYENDTFKRLPRWARESLHTVEATWQSAVMSLSCDWRMKWTGEAGGVYWLTGDEIDAADGVEWADITDGHYFHRSDGELKPFTEDFSTE